MRAREGRAREGHDRPRWRAKLRHRLDKVPASTLEPHREIEAWLDTRGWLSREVAVAEALDLTAYLRETSHIALTATERLRKLVVALEPGMSAADQPRSWLALERIYEAGRALDPTDAEIEISSAITAEECASGCRDRKVVHQRIIAAGRRAATRAIELRPADATAHHVLGMLSYFHPSDSIESALACFEKALSLDPDFGWARLYRAHCLHDLGRWAEAAEAYSHVDPSFLAGPRAWRYDLLREQKAWCLLQAGDRDGALAEFLSVLDRYEQQPGLARHQMLKELTAAAEGPLRAELFDRVARLRRRIGHGPDEPTSRGSGGTS